MLFDMISLRCHRMVVVYINTYVGNQWRIDGWSGHHFFLQQYDN
jgi:hypothetical protein